MDSPREETFSRVIARVDPHPTLRRSSNGLRFAEWREPRLLTDDSVAILCQALLRVSAEIFESGDLEAQSYWERERDDGGFAAYDGLVLIANDRDEIVGWTSYFRLTFGERHCLYFDASGLTKEYQRTRVIERIHFRTFAREIMANLWLYLRKPIYIIGVTKNAAVYTYLARALGTDNVSPMLDRPTSSDDVTEVADDFSNWFIAWVRGSGTTRDFAFQPETFCLKGVLVDFIDQRPYAPSGDMAVDQYFSDALQSNEDALLIIGRLRILGYARYWTIRQMQGLQSRRRSVAAT